MHSVFLERDTVIVLFDSSNCGDLKGDKMNHSFWEENSTMQHVKYESGDSVPCCEVLAPYSDSESTYGVRLTKNRVSRQDPLSHRIIEKRRRDRMNNCLADLSRLIPAEYLKKGRGRVEKTEIIEMAIKHMKHLQHLDHYRLGYQECMSETMRFLVEVEGRFPREPLCVRLLAHLQQHCDSLTKQTANEEPAKVEPNNNHVEEPMPLIEKHTEAYKYKTNIKLRFNQDLQHARRNSATSIENHSSSHSSPPSEICTRMSADNDSGQSDVTKGVAGGGAATVNTLRDNQNNFNVPVFVLHSKGTFYVPLSIDYQTLLPFLHDWDLLEVHSVLLHPVTINVSFPTGMTRVNYNYP